MVLEGTARESGKTSGILWRWSDKAKLKEQSDIILQPEFCQLFNTIEETVDLIFLLPRKKN